MKGATTVSRNFVARVDGHVRNAEPVAELPRRDDRGGRAARPVGVRARGIDPQPQGDPHRRVSLRRARSSATALSTPPLIATATRLGSSGASTADSRAVASASAASRPPGTAGCLERCQAVHVPHESANARPLARDVDDASVRNSEPNPRPLVSRSGVAEELPHVSTLAQAARRARSLAAGDRRARTARA